MGGAEPRAAPRAWRAPDLPCSEHRGRLTASRVLVLTPALLALFEPVTVAVHFQDVNVVGQPAFHSLPPAPYDACEKKTGRVSSLRAIVELGAQTVKQERRSYSFSGLVICG